MAEAISQIVTKELQSIISPSRFLFSVVRHGNKKLFQLTFFCLLVVLVFEVIVYDGDFTNDDPPFHVSQSWIVHIYRYTEIRLIKYFRETIHLSTIDRFNLLSRAPPA